MMYYTQIQMQIQIQIQIQILIQIQMSYEKKIWEEEQRDQPSTTAPDNDNTYMVILAFVYLHMSNTKKNTK